MDDPTSRVFHLTFASHYISDTEIFHDILGPGLKLVYLIDSFYLANREVFGRSDKKSFPSDICISFIATIRNIPRYSGSRVEACLFDRFVLFGE